MADDLKNVRLSRHATEIADRICESEFFEDRISVSKFALAYAIKNHFSEINPEDLDSMYDSEGSNYNIGSIDDDTVLSDITDVDLLGSAVHSQWRYLTHWAYTYQLDEDVCNWFIKVLQRMRDLARDITI